MLRSHLISMVIFAFIVSIMLAFIKYNDKKSILRYAVKLFLYMACSVILLSWVMYFL